jgi:hypothetical protein
MQTAILISNVIIIVVIMIGAIWLRHGVNHQLAAKDATIETLHAEIERLGHLTAPNLVTEIGHLSQFANAAQGTIHALKEKLKQLATQATSPADPSEAAVRGETYVAIYLDGMQASFDALKALFEELNKRSPTITSEPNVARLITTIRGFMDKILAAVDPQLREIARGKWARLERA